MLDWLRSILQYKVWGKGHYEDYDGIKHWVPAPYYWTWKWNK